MNIREKAWSNISEREPTVVFLSNRLSYQTSNFKFSFLEILCSYDAEKHFIYDHDEAQEVIWYIETKSKVKVIYSFWMTHMDYQNTISCWISTWSFYSPIHFLFQQNWAKILLSFANFETRYIYYLSSENRTSHVAWHVNGIVIV